MLERELTEVQRHAVLGMSSWGSGPALQAEPTGFDSPHLHGAGIATGPLERGTTVPRAVRSVGEHGEPEPCPSRPRKGCSRPGLEVPGGGS